MQQRGHDSGLSRDAVFETQTSEVVVFVVTSFSTALPVRAYTRPVAENSCIGYKVQQQQILCVVLRCVCLASRFDVGRSACTESCRNILRLHCRWLAEPGTPHLTVFMCSKVRSSEWVSTHPHTHASHLPRPLLRTQRRSTFSRFIRIHPHRRISAVVTYMMLSLFIKGKFFLSRRLLYRMSFSWLKTAYIHSSALLAPYTCTPIEIG